MLRAASRSVPTLVNVRDVRSDAIYLPEAFQHAGIGRRLVREWAAIAVDRGFRAAIVACSPQIRLASFTSDSAPSCSTRLRCGSATSSTLNPGMAGEISSPSRPRLWNDHDTDQTKPTDRTDEHQSVSRLDATGPMRLSVCLVLIRVSGI